MNERWSRITVAILVIGYAGYYLCRSDLSVARPLIMDQFPSIKKSDIGFITSIGTLLYAGGKFLFGSLSDQFGGRAMFLLGMIGAILATLLFGLGGPPLFLLAWSANRFVQSSGWVGMVNITGRWFGASVYGRVMAIISLSFLFGDFASRKFLGALIGAGLQWQQLFLVSAGVLALIAIPTWILLRDRPEERGLPSPPPNPVAIVTHGGGVWERLQPLLTSGRFWTICALSFGFTLMRETFNEWTPTFLHEVGKLSEAAAADQSAYFPLFGGLSVIAVGFLSDRLGPGRRAIFLAGGLLLGAVGLFFLSRLGSGSPGLIVATVAAIAFVLIGPYSLLAGAISLDFGGANAASTAAGWIDGVGYLGGILSGYGIARVAETAGWASAFQMLAVLALVSGVVATLYGFAEAKRIGNASRMDGTS